MQDTYKKLTQLQSLAAINTLIELAENSNHNPEKKDQMLSFLLFNKNKFISKIKIRKDYIKEKFGDEARTRQIDKDDDFFKHSKPRQE